LAPLGSRRLISNGPSQTTDAHRELPDAGCDESSKQFIPIANISFS
jgi:hypothetical protein